MVAVRSQPRVLLLPQVLNSDLRTGYSLRGALTANITYGIACAATQLPVLLGDGEATYHFGRGNSADGRGFLALSLVAVPKSLLHAEEALGAG